MNVTLNQIGSVPIDVLIILEQQIKNGNDLIIVYELIRSIQPTA